MPNQVHPGGGPRCTSVPVERGGAPESEARARPCRVWPFLVGGAPGWAGPGATRRRSGSWFRRRARRPRSRPRSRRAAAASPGTNWRSARRRPLPRPPRRALGTTRAAGRGLRGAALPASAGSAAKGGRRSLEAHRCKTDKKKVWGAGSAGWWGVRLAFRAWSLGLAAPGSEMSKPPPKPVKPGKGGARRILRPSQWLALLLPLGWADQARRRPRAQLSRSDPPEWELFALLRSLRGRDRFG